MINQLCCAALVLALVFVCLAIIVWAFCHVAALDREAQADKGAAIDDE